MTTLATALVFVCAAVASGFQLFQILAAYRFLRHPGRRPAGPLPPVTLLKPLKGPGVDLYANLASFCRLVYPAPVQIVFGVADPRDPAVAVVQRLRRDFPDRDIVLAVGDGPGANRKIANLQQMMAHARHDVLVMSDSDIRVRPDYLRTMVAPLVDRKVGLTTCLYRGRGHGRLPSFLESLFVNADFAPMVLVAHALRHLRWAYGASIAVRRSALDDIGGFAGLGDYLADDYQLGNRVDAAGWRLVLLPYVVETVLDSETLGEVWRHQLRWARTYRTCEPVGWFFSILTHATLWGLVAAVVTGFSSVGLATLAAAVGLRLASLATIMRLLGERGTLAWLLLVPLKDVVTAAIWLAAFLGRRVVWSGQLLRVERDGRMAPVGAPEPGVAAVADGVETLRAAGS